MYIYLKYKKMLYVFLFFFWYGIDMFNYFFLILFFLSLLIHFCYNDTYNR